MRAHGDRRSSEARELRRQGGQYLRQLRDAAGLTQRELAERVGIGYYTFISQIESGASRPPPDLLDRFAEALEIDLPAFTMTLLRYYEPSIFKWLGGKPTTPNAIPNPARLRLSRLATEDGDGAGLSP